MYIYKLITNVIQIDLCNLKVAEKCTQIKFILDNILQVPPMGTKYKSKKPSKKIGASLLKLIHSIVGLYTWHDSGCKQFKDQSFKSHLCFYLFLS